MAGRVFRRAVQNNPGYCIFIKWNWNNKYERKHFDHVQKLLMRINYNLGICYYLSNGIEITKESL